MKKKRITLIAAGLVLLTVLSLAFIFIAPPYLQRYAVRNQYGSLEDWAEYVRREDARFWTETNSDELAEIIHTPADSDLIFASNELVEIFDDIHVVGVYGVTDWRMYLNVFSRERVLTKETASNTEDINDVYKYRLRIHNAEDSSLPESMHQNLLYAITPVLGGFRSDIEIQSPVYLENDKITLTIEYGEAYELEKTITVPVQTLQYKDG